MLHRPLPVLLAGLSLVAGCLALFSGPPSFDYIDGTEFVIAGRNLDLPHPPGYPVYMFAMRTFSLLAPCEEVDYSCFRMFSALVAMGLAAVSFAAMRSLGCTSGGSLAGSLLLVTSPPVMGQLNLVEVHGLAILLVLAAVALRGSRAGPYAFSMALFAGHPVSVFLLPAALSDRYRERWVLLAAVPASLWLFVPLRSSFQGLCHYSSPAGAWSMWRYLGLYGSRLGLPSMDGPRALLETMGIAGLSAVLILAVLSLRWSWKLFASAAGGLLFISSYSIPDTPSITWIAALPLLLWASMGLSRLMGQNGWRRVTALFLVLVSAVSGTVLSWRREDSSAETIAGDYLRGAPLGAVFVTSGMSTFHTAYMLEVMDRRPDIVPMDRHRCFFRMQPPETLPGSIGGRPVAAVREWDSRSLHLNGLLFAAAGGPVDWSIYDIYDYSGRVADGYASDEIAELWARRGIQAATVEERNRCRDEALAWAVSRMTRERVRILFESY